MRITEIEIEHCGVWHNLRLPLQNTGLSLFYGPNEAGKSTLMNFVRGMLYGFSGFEPAESRLNSPPSQICGALTLSTEQGSYRLHRRGNQQTENHLAITGPDDGELSREAFQELLGDVDQEIFQSVFAVGLRELQELGSLHDNEVAEKIYGLTLGPQSLRILQALEEVNRESAELLSDDQQTGELADLFREQDRLQSELNSLGGLKQQYSELAEACRTLEAEIGDIQSRQGGIKSQLRGHLYLQRAYGPWSRVQEYEAELAELPVVDSFPEQGIERLDEIELQLAAAAEQRDRLKNESRTLLEQAGALGGAKDIAKYEVTLQGLVDQREWIAELEKQVGVAQSQYDDLEQQINERLPQWGEEWSAKQFPELDTSPAAYERLVGKARGFKRAIARREKTKRTGKRLSNLCQNQETKLTEGLSGYGVESAGEALDFVRTRLTDMETLGELKLTERELHKRQLGYDELRQHTETRMSLPPSYYICLWVLNICSLISVVGGLANAVFNEIAIGGVFALFGLMLYLLGRLAKQHFERGMDERLAKLTDSSDRNLEELRAVRAQILDVLGEAPGKSDEQAWLPEADEMRRCAREIAKLERLSLLEKKLERNRARLEQSNNKLYESQRDVAGARQAWQQVLTQTGMPETLDVAQAFEVWQTLVELSNNQHHFRLAKIELKSRREMYASFCRRIAAVGRRLHQWDHDFEQPVAILDHWQEQLKALHSGRGERRRLRSEARDLSRKSAGFRKMVEQYQSQRTALLEEAGASDREEFETRATAMSRHVLLKRQLQQAHEDLQAAGESDRELAVTEEDLQLFESEYNSECIGLLKMEQEDLQTDLQAAYEKLGGVKRELEHLATNRQSRDIRRELARIEQQIRTVGTKWFALQRAKQAVDQMRHHVERTRQPVTIADASRYLARITCGKYQNIWTPLGKRSLRIDDEQGHSLSVESLSSGTREQLFLSIRMALIHDYARHGVTLPMVLDDVLVNFDEHRCEAAIDSLLEFSQQGHQVLMFTCHRHLAHLLQSKGHEPNWLPNRGASAEAA